MHWETCLPSYEMFVYDPSYLILQLWDVRKLLHFFGAANILEPEKTLHEQDNWTASSKGFLPKQP